MGSLWMYTAVVRHILMYDSTLWRPVLCKKYSCSATLPADILNELLHFFLLDLDIEYVEACSIVKLHESKPVDDWGMTPSVVILTDSQLTIKTLYSVMIWSMAGGVMWGNVGTRYPDRAERSKSSSFRVPVIETDGD